MELLKPADGRILCDKCSSFTFQYGATKTLPYCLIKIPLHEFTFQYGATKTDI